MLVLLNTLRTFSSFPYKSEMYGQAKPLQNPSSSLTLFPSQLVTLSVIIGVMGGGTVVPGPGPLHARRSMLDILYNRFIFMYNKCCTVKRKKYIQYPFPFPIVTFLPLPNVFDSCGKVFTRTNYNLILTTWIEGSILRFFVCVKSLQYTKHKNDNF